MESQKRYPRVFSCEFFPPNDEQSAARLKQAQERLAAIKPAFFSVTYGAGGTTRNRTFEAVLNIQQNSGVEAAPHLTCVASTLESVRAILHYYIENGIRRIVALRGDRPSGAGLSAPGELRYANELVEFIRKETGEHFHIEVAAYPEFHPQARSPVHDIANFKRKIDAGANSAITQYFYSAEAYLRFVDSCEKAGIDVPIIPGIMPITNYKQLARFSAMCGAEIPSWLRKRLEMYGDDLEAIREFGLEVVAELCRQLLQQGAPGLHFYTMNRAAPTLSIWEAISG